MEKRLFLAIILSMATLMIWQVLFLPAVPPPRSPAALDVPSAAGTPAVPGTSRTQEGEPAQPLAPEGLEMDPSAEKVVVVDSPLYRAALTSRGAALKSFRLKGYAHKPNDPDRVEMVPQYDEVLEYFQQEYSEPDRAQVIGQVPKEFQNLYLPYSLRLLRPGPTPADRPTLYAELPLAHAIFQVEAPRERVELQRGESTKIVFRLLAAPGLQVTKTLTFHGDSYLADVQVELRNVGAQPLPMIPEMVVTEGYRRAGIPETTRYDHSTPVYGADLKRHIPDIPERGEQKVAHHPQLEWAAVEDLYFFSSLLPPNSATTVVVEKTRFLQLLRVLVRFDPIELAPGQSTELALQGYFGPKEHEKLQQIGHNLERIIDWGIFRALALPAVWFLGFVRNLTGSYGIAIIVLTIFVRLAMYPLTATQIRSMEKMKAVAPELERIKAKYKDAKDPERFNQEMMSLYKRHGVNPASGCLPMLLQMPVFLALYSAMLYSIQLRHTPFLYIPDLSTPDPYFLSPLLMGASMVWQTRMSPAPADPSQAMMMKVMPIVFTGLFLFAPSGLVIYWMMNNVLSIAQQYALQKRKAKA